MKTVLLSIVLVSMVTGACNRGDSTTPLANSAAASSEVVKTYPHSRDAYTQGLILHEGQLTESTGREGKSRVRRADIETGDIVQKVSSRFEYSGEGSTLLN